MEIYLPEDALVSLKFVDPKEIISVGCGKHSRKNGRAGSIGVTEVTDIPLYSAREPSVSYSEVSRLNYGVCEEKLSLFLLVVE